MDFAVSSGHYAAQAVLAAKAKGDFSASALSAYKTLLENSYVLKDMRLYRSFPAFMDNPRIFNDYPQMIAELMNSLFIVDGQPATPLMKKAKSALAKVGVTKMAKDAMKGVRSL
jgi:electron transfer flavoprotein-quinone oxidoreductase